MHERTLDGVAEELAQRLAEVRVHGESGDRLVSVTLDGIGKIVEMHIDPKTLRLGTEQLVDRIQEAVNQARDATTAEAGERASSLTSALAEPDGDFAEMRDQLAGAMRQLISYTDAAAEAMRRMRDAM